MDTERELFDNGGDEAGLRNNFGDEDSVRAMLEQKDRDLMLAAELGKALLEKNSDLEKKLEQTVEEYNQHIEALEQERHGLHLKLENLEGEYENTVKELQYDISQLREELDRNKHDSYTGDKNKLNRIQELSQQNERLLDELQNAKRLEHEYESELQTIKNSGLANISAKQAYQIEHLQEQISSLSGQKSDLERSYEKVSDERESLLGVIEETQDRIKVLERQKADQEDQLCRKDEEIRDLHERNSHLNIQIDHLTEKASNSSGHSITLFNELSQLPGNQDMSMATGSPINPYPPSMFGDDEIECDDDDYLMSSSSPLRFEDTTAEQCGQQYHTQETEMENEIVHAYKHLRQICREIKAQLGDKVSDKVDEDAGASSISDDSGSLNDVVVELRDTIHGAIQQANQTQTTHLEEIHSLQQRVGELERDLTECQTNLQKLEEQLHIRDVHLQQKSYKITELSRQVGSQHEDIKILSNQRDKLQDMLAPDTTKPQMYSAMALLRHARRERDAAIEKRYSMEKDLQQSKYEIIVLNHQLMEAIHQKNKVSQLLDQWQSDMANLLGVQMEAGINPALKLGSQADAGSKPSTNLKENDSRTEVKKENEEQPSESVT
ncbi:BICD family-like cargo adapter 1 [Ruditapes philippinarum]|uniref:BICD family-like cargo adapter 1 n=1 Tax=Ruditapes philippinarum TaxID=129788 RepID=UPI00295B1235|nr:BICD family-like cargo adapter 1 [Ruditapes philippinarum]